MTDAEIKAMPLPRTLAGPLKATRTFADRLAITHWIPATWRTYSIPIWYGLPALQEDLDRILAALNAEHGRGIAPVPVEQARTACHQAGEELDNLMVRIDGIWTGRSEAAVGGADLLRVLPSLADASNRLLNTLDRLIASVNAIPLSNRAGPGPD